MIPSLFISVKKGVDFHRLIGSENLDMTLVLDQGKLVEQGMRDTLFVRDSLYQEMFRLQNQIVILDELLP
jgi:ABC-type transport system involved in cytochrome bd biosynthesis fused ATPase/permease subunit